jgi:hypothetical protein
MAKVETIGGGVAFTPDGKKVTKQVYVLTEGETSITLDQVSGSALTSVEFQKGEAGTQRVTASWTEGQSGGGYSGFGGAGGSTVELIGSTREVPMKAHKDFKVVSERDLAAIEKAISENKALNISADGDGASPAGTAEDLYSLLLKGFDTYLAPAVVLRVTGFVSSPPSLSPLCTITAPGGSAPQVPSGSNWLLTAINYRSVATPTGGVQYETTKEWTLSPPTGWNYDYDVYETS